MEYQGTLIAVRDMEKSLKFYRDVLGLSVIADYGANKVLTGGISLQTVETWAGFIGADLSQIKFGHRSAELYFEESDLDAVVKKCDALGVEKVHGIQEHSWGQRAIRIFDPDRHMIEVGESIKRAAERFLAQGMTTEQIAVRMDVSVGDVLKFFA